MLPQRPGKIGIAVCVLVCLGLFALLRFPKDEKSSEGGFPSKNTRGIYEPGMTEPPPKGGMVQEGMVQGGMVQGGMVQLKEITPVPVNHDGSGAMKKEEGLMEPSTRAFKRFRGSFRVPYPFFVELVELVKQRDWFPTGQEDAVGRPCIPVELKAMILNGQVPHLTGFTRAVFSPGDEVQTHSHATMDEVFYGEAGKGNIEVDGVMVEMTPGTCVHVVAGQKHNLKNHGDEDWAILYFGIATGSVGGEMNAVSTRAPNP